MLGTAPSIRNKFVYPAGARPGVNFDHPVFSSVRGTLKFSGVTGPTGFVRLDRGSGAPTITGTPAWIMDGQIGPAYQPSASTGNSSPGLKYTNVNTDSSTAVTWACIFRYLGGSSNGNVPLHSGTTANNGLFVDSSGNFGCVVNGGGRTFIALTVGGVYFGVVSLSSFTLNAVLVNLRSGVIKTTTGAGSAFTDSEAQVTVGNYFGNNANFIGNIAAGAILHFAPTMPVMLQWANDPWSFWYPDQFPFDYSGVHLVAGGAAKQRMLLMGVGQ